MRRFVLFWCALPVVGLGVFVIGLSSTTTAEENADSREIKSRIEWWQKNFPQYTTDLGIPETPSLGTRKGIALSIGLNEVDPAHYAGWLGTLEACEADAKAMADIAESQGFVKRTLLTKEARYDSVFGEIRKAAGELKSGDIFLLSYSGHGGQAPDLNGDEDDRQDETLCLYDREVIDDELAELWAQFAAGVRIVMVSDSCHSGSVSKAKDYARITEVRPPPKAIAPEALKQKFQDLVEGKTHTARVSSPVRAIPEDVQKKVLEKNSAYYTRLGRTVPNQKVSERNTPASVLLLAACQDNQLSLEIGDRGLFTGLLIEVWNGGRFVGGYRDFHRALKEKMPLYQVPNLFPTGTPNPEFEAEKPFTVSK